jgi:phosphate transport system permease protein
MQNMIRTWFKSGLPWVWLNAAAVALCLVMVIAVLGLVVVRGVGHFWPSSVQEYSYIEDNGSIKSLIGEHVDSSVMTAAMAISSGHKMTKDEDALVQYLVKTGNRDLIGTDFRWILQRNIKTQQEPEDLMVIERREWGNFYGRLVSVKENGRVIATGEQAWPVAQEKLDKALLIFKEIVRLEKKEIGAVNYQLERLRLKQRKLEIDHQWNAEAEKDLASEKVVYDEQYKKYQVQLAELYQKVRQDSLIAKIDNGSELEVTFAKIVKIYQPNAMNFFQRIGYFFGKAHEFLTDDPRESNTEGGIFPAIFGTIMMVIMMSIIVTPFGVIAAVYLREYAKQGFITRLIRIAVNNLAGVPSIVYGVFGLGFFVYILGGNIDKLFFPEAAPAPVYGTPGLLWASITLALLTLPVVIVSTEEGLSRIPKSIREGSLALGATKFETLWQTVLPMASPAMMTGLILAVARAAGEVAPLMLVGVVKLAPTLPLDGNFPFLHLDRKFMHLGFHIYDVGFQSPNVEAARPLVYATSLLLVLVILGLNLSAIIIRNRLREKYRALEG